MSFKKSYEFDPLLSSSQSSIAAISVATAASNTLRLNSPLYCVSAPHRSVNTIFKE
ncbi:MAG: Uncharacterised protein [Polaribacter sp. SA4-10]|nr:MAG: Uncharacterised protein [Polaribacter sp. SA4-10]